MSEKDGGPAFPDDRSQVGMSLRDYFAAEAIAECIRVANDQTQGAAPLLSELFAKAAAYTYFMADAMLAERAK